MVINFIDTLCINNNKLNKMMNKINNKLKKMMNKINNKLNPN
jgi:chaperonin cofactor prefoldin